MTRTGATARRRNPAEWVTLATASLVLAIVVGIAVSRIPADDPPRPTATMEGEVESQGDGWLVRVAVHNGGDDPAAAVHVVMTLTDQAGTVEIDQVVDLLAGGDDERLTFVLDRDPSGGELDVRVSGYAEP